MKVTHLFFVAVLCASACDKPPPPTPSSSAKTADDKVPVPSVTQASATASAQPSNAASVASAAPSTSGSAPAKEYTCGAKGQPKCPLQGWMAANMQPAMAAADAKKLAAALRASAKLGPQSYGDWAKLANEGADAVEKANDVKAGKPSCKSCHEQYQKPYKAEFRDRPI